MATFRPVVRVRESNERPPEIREGSQTRTDTNGSLVPLSPPTPQIPSAWEFSYDSVRLDVSLGQIGKYNYAQLRQMVFNAIPEIMDKDRKELMTNKGYFADCIKSVVNSFDCIAIYVDVFLELVRMPRKFSTRIITPEESNRLMHLSGSTDKIPLLLFMNEMVQKYYASRRGVDTGIANFRTYVDDVDVAPSSIEGLRRAMDDMSNEIIYVTNTEGGSDSVAGG